MSKLYGIEVWGQSASDKQISQMQVIQILIMRWICAAKRGTRTRDLLRMTGMMSMRQLVMYRVLMAGLTASWNSTPAAMSTRKEKPVRRLQLTRSFRFYFSKMYQSIPDSILMKDPKKSKSEINKWIYRNIPWNEKWEGIGETTLETDDSENDDD